MLAPAVEHTLPTDPFRAIRGAHIAHLIESSGPGGAERMVADLAREQQVRGCRTTVFLPENGEGWLAAQLEGSAVSVEHYALDTPLSPRCAWQLANAFRRRGITLAHSHEFSMAVYGSCAARAAQIPHVITMHGARYYAGKMQRRLAMRFAVASSQATFAVSSTLARQLSEDLRVERSRIDVVPNGVQPGTPVASTLRTELGIPAAVPIVLAVGNLYPVKGHRVLLEALALLPTDAHVVIAGRGASEQDLLGLAEQRGLLPRLHLLGLRNDIPNLLAAADVFVQPSLAEGLPMAVLEAMFAGRPIVASNVGDVGEAVGDDGALLVPPGDARELAAALTRVLEQPVLASALGANARGRAMRSYGLSSMVERYAALYAPLIAPRYWDRPAERRARSGAERRVPGSLVTLPERRRAARRWQANGPE